MTEDTRRFVGPEGEFVPSIPRKDGTISIGFLEELGEWIYYHDALTDDEKLERMLDIEKIIIKLLSEIMPGCGFKPTWSKKQKDKMKKT